MPQLCHNSGTTIGTTWSAMCILSQLIFICCLKKTSFHPKHTFSGILKSQITKCYHICSELSEFEKAGSILCKALSKRNYSKRWMRRIKKNNFHIDLKWREMQSKVIFGQPKWGGGGHHNGQLVSYTTFTQRCWDIVSLHNVVTT